MMFLVSFYISIVESSVHKLTDQVDVPMHDWEDPLLLTGDLIKFLDEVVVPHKLLVPWRKVLGRLGYSFEASLCNPSAFPPLAVS